MCDIIIFWAVHKKFSLTNFADQHNYCTQYAIGCSGILCTTQVQVHVPFIVNGKQF